MIFGFQPDFYGPHPDPDAADTMYTTGPYHVVSPFNSFEVGCVLIPKHETMVAFENGTLDADVKINPRLISFIEDLKQQCLPSPPPAISAVYEVLKSWMGDTKVDQTADSAQICAYKLRDSVIKECIDKETYANMFKSYELYSDSPEANIKLSQLPKLLAYTLLHMAPQVTKLGKAGAHRRL
ncbi:hypothetical protein HDE_00884 [Halotydeus destructor]|nr:hypothetical protein HDE_00884 [Halotydeus destructor]